MSSKSSSGIGASPKCTCTCTCTKCTCTFNTPDGMGIVLEKVFSSLPVQVILTILVVLMIISVQPVTNFFVSIRICLAFYLCALVLPFTVIRHRYSLYWHHPANLFSHGVLTVVICFVGGLACSLTKGFYFLGPDPNCVPSPQNPSSPVRAYERTSSYNYEADICPSDYVVPLLHIILVFICGAICGVVIFVWYLPKSPAQATVEGSATGDAPVPPVATETAPNPVEPKALDATGDAPAASKAVDPKAPDATGAARKTVEPTGDALDETPPKSVEPKSPDATGDAPDARKAVEPKADEAPATVEATGDAPAARKAVEPNADEAPATVEPTGDAPDETPPKSVEPKSPDATGDAPATRKAVEPKADEAPATVEAEAQS